MRKTRRCSGYVIFVWKPTMLKSRPSASSWRSCTQACGRCPVRGSIRPTGRIGPNASVAGPRRAISSIGMQPSKYTQRSKSRVGTLSAATTASTKAAYWVRSSGQLM